MKKLYFFVLLSLLPACGQQEDKLNAEDLIRERQGQGEDPDQKKQMNDREFLAYCERRNGELRAGNSVCSFVKKKFDLEDKIPGSNDKTYKDQLRKEGSLTIDMGNIVHGSLLSAQLKGGQPVTFVINGNVFMTIRDGVPIVKQPTGSGKLTIRIDYAVYEFFNAFVRQCDSRTGTPMVCDPGQ